MSRDEVVAQLKAHTSTEIVDGVVVVYLSRRNLETLLNKLDANRRDPGTSQCTIIKMDMAHPVYPQSHPRISVTAVEDEAYYEDREPGEVKKFEVH